MIGDINPNDESALSRLREHVNYSRWKLEPFRRHRFNAIRDFVGFNYSDHGTADRVPINLLEMAVNIFTRQLAANVPRVLITTPHIELKPSAIELELASNYLLPRMNFEKTMRRLVQDALFSIGVRKVGMSIIDPIKIKGFNRDTGAPFCDSVDLDDFFYDVSARHWEECTFIGNIYRVSYEELMNSPHFSQNFKDQVAPTYTRSYNEWGDERVETMSRGPETGFTEFVPVTELADIWLPRQQLFITVPWEGSIFQMREDIEWRGPDRGPYDILTYTDVPGNVMPLSPVALWRDLHDLANNLLRKLARQAERQKDVIGYSGTAEDDASRIETTSDGQFVRMDHPGETQEFKFGGTDQSNLAFFMVIRELFNYMGGNLDALGGLGPQSETLGQDQLLQASASKRISDMQAKTTEFTKGIIRDLGWYLIATPGIKLPLTRTVEESGISMPFEFAPDGAWLDYNFTIDPYSMRHESPQSRLQTVSQVFSQFIQPFAPMLAEQGVTIDFQALIRLVAKYSNMTELEEILIFMQPDTTTPRIGPVGEAPGKPAVTRRENVRISRSGSTRAGIDGALIQGLLTGGGVQQSELAGAMGRTG